VADRSVSVPITLSHLVDPDFKVTTFFEDEYLSNKVTREH